MTDVLKIDHGEPAAQTLPEVEFALIISRTINALNDDPALLRSSVYELARINLWKDLSDGDPERGQRLAQALETAIRGVEGFQTRQNGAGGRGGSIAGPINKFSETARLVGSALPADVYPPTEHRAAALPVIQIDHPAFETATDGYTFGRDKPARLNGSTVRAAMLAFGIALGVVLAGAILTNRIGIKSFLARETVSPPRSAKAEVDQSTAPAATAPPPIAPSPPPIPGLPLPASYGNYAVKNGKLAEIELLEGQVPDRRIAVSSPIQTPSRTVLPDGSPTFVIFRRDLATISTDSIEARVVAKIRHTMKVDSQTRQATFTPEELWSIRPFAYKFRSAPVPGNPEMIFIKPDDGVVLPPGRYVLVLKRQGYDFTVAGKITDPNQCLERTEATNGTFYSPCSKVP